MGLRQILWVILALFFLTIWITKGYFTILKAHFRNLVEIIARSHAQRQGKPSDRAIVSLHEFQWKTSGF